MLNCYSAEHDGTAAHAASKQGLGMDYIRQQRAPDYSKAALTVKNLRAFGRSDEAAPRRDLSDRDAVDRCYGPYRACITPSLMKLAKLQPEGGSFGRIGG
jgi:hypothetical protein